MCEKSVLLTRKDLLLQKFESDTRELKLKWLKCVGPIQIWGEFFYFLSIFRALIMVGLCFLGFETTRTKHGIDVYSYFLNWTLSKKVRDKNLIFEYLLGFSGSACPKKLKLLWLIAKHVRKFTDFFQIFPIMFW